MAPGPSISAKVTVLLALTCMKGETFQPWPRSRAAPRAGPLVDIPALPFSPVKFSGLIDRVFASDNRNKLPMFTPMPLKPAADAFNARAKLETDRINHRQEVLFIVWLWSITPRLIQQ